MDPNVALRYVRQYLDMIRDANTMSDRAAGAMLIADHLGDLDEWLSKGGFLPEAWASACPETSAPPSLGTDEAREPESQPAQ